ncbi:MAG TPA: ATP-binding protein [Candidatus Deferrimicrobiaceae bacterium]|nr:ATP-binding protein [Candidatus Deferrimicrobiaceae bacterium]
MKKDISVRASVVLQLMLIAVASLSLLAVFALKVIEITIERRYVEAAVSVGEVVRWAIQAEGGVAGKGPSLAIDSIVERSPYIREVAILPEGEVVDGVRVTPVGENAPWFFAVHPTVDVTLPPGVAEGGDNLSAGPPGNEKVLRSIRVRLHSPKIEQENRNLFRITALLVGVDVVAFVLVGFLLMDRSVVRPLRRLAAVSEKIASGDLSLRAEGSPANEVGQLGASFNRMVGAILNAQEKATRAQQEAFRSEKLATLGRLAAGVAHEVGNPLMGIRGYAEYLRRNHPPAEEIDECLDKIVSETGRIENIVRGLLSVASSERDGEEAADVDEVIREIVEMLSFRKIFREIEVIVETRGVGRVSMSAERFRQVLLNLMINAVDAMEGGGVLRVRAFGVRPWVPPAFRNARRRASDPPGADVLRLRENVGALPEGAVAVSVTDTGCGIRPDALPLIFDPFFTTKETGKGTGLGLSVSHAIVEAAGGEIEVASEQGKGSTFTVILPEAGDQKAPGDGNGRTDG